MNPERFLPLVAEWGPAVLSMSFAAALIASLPLLRRRAREGRAHVPVRIGGVVLLPVAALFGLGLYAVLVPLRPMLDQVRSVRRLVGRPAGEIEYRLVSDDTP